MFTPDRSLLNAAELLRARFDQVEFNLCYEYKVNRMVSTRAMTYIRYSERLSFVGITVTGRLSHGMAPFTGVFGQ